MENAFFDLLFLGLDLDAASLGNKVSSNRHTINVYNSTFHVTTND